MSIFNRKDESLKLSRIKTGWQVDHDFETDTIDKEGRKDTDYNTETYAFETIDQAVAKMVELSEGFK